MEISVIDTCERYNSESKHKFARKEKCHEEASGKYAEKKSTKHHPSFKEDSIGQKDLQTATTNDCSLIKRKHDENDGHIEAQESKRIKTDDEVDFSTPMDLYKSGDFSHIFPLNFLSFPNNNQSNQFSPQ